MIIDYELAVPSTWTPRAPQIGQWVSIRLSEECAALRASTDQEETSTHYHSRSESGLTGIVIEPTPGVWMPRLGLEWHDHLIDFYPEAFFRAASRSAPSTSLPRS